MQNNIYQSIAPVLAPAVAAVALGQIIDEYKIKGLYTEELDAFLRACAERVDVVIRQVGHELLPEGQPAPEPQQSGRHARPDGGQ